MLVLDWDGTCTVRDSLVAAVHDLGDPTVYDRDYESKFRAVDEWVSGLSNLTTFGRQGLFAHDNTHHALFMAYSAVDCLVDGTFDQSKWAEYRKVFATHVVED